MGLTSRGEDRGRRVDMETLRDGLKQIENGNAHSKFETSFVWLQSALFAQASLRRPEAWQLVQFEGSAHHEARIGLGLRNASGGGAGRSRARQAQQGLGGEDEILLHRAAKFDPGAQLGHARPPVMEAGRTLIIIAHSFHAPEQGQPVQRAIFQRRVERERLIGRNRHQPPLVVEGPKRAGETGLMNRKQHLFGLHEGPRPRRMRRQAERQREKQATQHPHPRMIRPWATSARVGLKRRHGNSKAYAGKLQTRPLWFSVRRL